MTSPTFKVLIIYLKFKWDPTRENIKYNIKNELELYTHTFSSTAEYRLFSFLALNFGADTLKSTDGKVTGQ